MEEVLVRVRVRVRVRVGVRGRGSVKVRVRVRVRVSNLRARVRVSPNPNPDPNPDQVLLESMYHLPSWSAQGVRHCLVTEDTVLRGAMSELYPQPQVEAADDPEEPPAAALG